MRGAIPSLSHTTSWRGAWLSTVTTLPLSFLQYSVRIKITIPTRICLHVYLKKSAYSSSSSSNNNNNNNSHTHTHTHAQS